MGGIVIKPSSPTPFIPSSASSTLTANGVSLLLKTSPHLLPDISASEIKDKSKASSLTKLLACLQASWFCLSVLTRFAQRLPVSMLELNAFAHALCTLAVYVLWWHKPLDVSQPVFVSEEELDPLLAYMWMASETSRLPGKQGDEVNSYEVGKDPEFEAILLDKTPPPSSESMKDTDNGDLLALGERRMGEEGQASGTATSTVQVTPTKPLPGTNFLSNPSSTRWIETRTETIGVGDDAKSTSHTMHHSPIFHLHLIDTHRWHLAHQALTTHKLAKPTKNLDLITTKAISETLDNKDNADDKHKPIPPLWSIPLLFLLGSVYGGLHALGWNAKFPSEREKLLWRVSACVVASPVLFIILLSFWFILIDIVSSCFPSLSSSSSSSSSPSSSSTKETEKDKEEKRMAMVKLVLTGMGLVVKGLVIGLFSVAIAFVYLPARVFLVYESVRTVFYLPPEAFITATWTQYLIHVT